VALLAPPAVLAPLALPALPPEMAAVEVGTAAVVDAAAVVAPPPALSTDDTHEQTACADAEAAKAVLALLHALKIQVVKASLLIADCEEHWHAKSV